MNRKQKQEVELSKEDAADLFQISQAEFLKRSKN